MLGMAFLGIFPLVRALGFKSWRDVGLPAPRLRFRTIGHGFLFGLGSLFILGVFLMTVGARGMDVRHSWPVELGRTTIIMLSAITVGFLEELLFRGTLFGSLRLAMPWRLAVVVSSFIYGLLHFLQKPDPPAHVDWTTGLQVLGQMLSGLWPPHRLGAELVCLILAGSLLALAYQRTGTLYFSIGLHAGWIFWARTFNLLTSPEESKYLWLWGTGRLYDGWMTSVVLAVMLVFMWNSSWWYKRQAEPSPGNTLAC
jgi:membrane protease YdiL (CAAX protease family)